MAEGVGGGSHAREEGVGHGEGRKRTKDNHSRHGREASRDGNQKVAEENERRHCREHAKPIGAATPGGDAELTLDNGKDGHEGLTLLGEDKTGKSGKNGCLPIFASEWFF